MNSLFILVISLIQLSYARPEMGMPMPEGLRDQACKFELRSLTESGSTPGTSRSLVAQSDASIMQTLAYLGAIPQIRDRKDWAEFVRITSSIVGSPNQWLEDDSSIKSANTGEAFQRMLRYENNSEKFRPKRLQWEAGVRWAQKIRLNSATDIILGTLKWRQTTITENSHSDTWRFQLTFTNESMGKYHLEIRIIELPVPQQN